MNRKRVSKAPKPSAICRVCHAIITHPYDIDYVRENGICFGCEKQLTDACESQEKDGEEWDGGET